MKICVLGRFTRTHAFVFFFFNSGFLFLKQDVRSSQGAAILYRPPSHRQDSEKYKYVLTLKPQMTITAPQRHVAQETHESIFQ